MRVDVGHLHDAALTQPQRERVCARKAKYIAVVPSASGELLAHEVGALYLGVLVTHLEEGELGDASLNLF